MRRALVFSLRARNVDVLTALEAGMINRSDEDHLALPPDRDGFYIHSTWRTIAFSIELGYPNSGFMPGL